MRGPGACMLPLKEVGSPGRWRRLYRRPGLHRPRTTFNHLHEWWIDASIFRHARQLDQTDGGRNLAVMPAPRDCICIVLALTNIR